MRKMGCRKTQVEILKDKIGKMLDESDGKINRDIVEVSQALDKLILQELKIKED